MRDDDEFDDENEPEGELPAEKPAETPAQAIDRLARELRGIVRRPAGESIEYVRDGIIFAVKAGSKVEFKLRTEIAAAGLRTPATARSSRGQDWIALDTHAGDTFTVDRVVAWFETAWRIAGESKGTPRPN